MTPATASTNPQSTVSRAGRISLTVAIARILNWPIYAAGVGLAVGLSWLASLHTGGADVRAPLLRVALIALSLSAVSLFEDEANELTQTAPRGGGFQRRVRLLVTSAVWILGSFLVVGVGSIDLPSEEGVHSDQFIIEGLAEVGVVLAVAGVVSLSQHSDSSGASAAATLLTLLAISWLLPRQLRPWIVPGHIDWNRVRALWHGVALVTWGVAIATVAIEPYRALTVHSLQRSLPASVPGLGRSD